MVFKFVFLSLLFSLFRVGDVLEIVMDMSKEFREFFVVVQTVIWDGLVEGILS